MNDTLNGAREKTSRGGLPPRPPMTVLDVPSSLSTVSNVDVPALSVFVISRQRI